MYLYLVPNSINVHILGWLSVWCRQYSQDFGHVMFPMESGSGSEDQDGNGGSNIVNSLTILSMMLFFTTFGIIF